MTPLVIESWTEIGPRHLVAPALPPAKLLVRGVGGDAIDPAAERGLALEHADLPRRRPEGVLHHFLGILLVTGDPDRQPVDAIAVGVEQELGRGRIAATQRLHEGCVPVDAHGPGPDTLGRAGRRGSLWNAHR